MIANITDRRSNDKNVNCDVVFEPSCHDNSIKGATKFDWSTEFSIDQLFDTTVIEAIEYAKKYSCEVTMYLYDPGSRPV